jgi:hypothetical protein
MTIPMIHLIQRIAAIGIIRRSESLTTARQIFFWWEYRRIFYNFAVGVVGLAVVVLMVACGFFSEQILGEPIGIPDPPIFAIFGIVAYGILANVCYTGGWITELLIRAAWHCDTRTFGERAFTLGLLFSVLLTLFPALLTVSVAGVKIFLHFYQRG